MNPKYALLSKRSQPENATYYMIPAKCHSEKGKIWLPIPVFLGFPGGSDSKESACNAGDLGSIPGLGRPPGEENGYLLQCSCLENSMDRGAWQATVLSLSQRNNINYSVFSFRIEYEYIFV